MRTHSPLEYVSIPVIPETSDTNYHNAGPSSRPAAGVSYPTMHNTLEDEPPAPNSGLTTPRSGPLSPSRANDENLPRVHSGLTTPENERDAPAFPSAQVSQVPDQPPLPVRLMLADPSPPITFPEPQMPFPEPQLTPMPIPPVSDLPNIPTPDDPHAPSQALDTRGPPPPFEEVIKGVDVPDELQSLADQESVISGGDRAAVILKADEIRKKAKAQEKERDRVRREWRRAEREGRYFDALRLELEAEDAQAAVDGLHAKAARRYYHGK